MIRVGEVSHITQVSGSGQVERTFHLPIEREQQKPVEHFWWVSEAAREAEAAGIEIPAICGAWDGPLEWNGDPDHSDSPGRILAYMEPDDCPACLKVLENQVLGRLMLD